MKTRNFTVKIDNKDVEISVVSPSLEDRKEAEKIYNNAFTEALKSKAVVRARLDDLLIDQGLWNDNKQQKFETLQREILDLEKKLAEGGIPLSSAKEIALEIRKLRGELRQLISVKTDLDSHTAEGQAENEKFNYLVFACTYYADTKKRFFNSYKDYLDKNTEQSAILAAQNLANMMYGLDNDYEEKLPENKFLKDYKFVDEKLRLIDKQGRLVDQDGRLIDANGRFINENGEFVDKFGNKLDEKGDYVVDFKPFLDDEGNPILVEQTTPDSGELVQTEENTD